MQRQKVARRATFARAAQTDGSAHQQRLVIIEQIGVDFDDIVYFMRQLEEYPHLEELKIDVLNAVKKVLEN